MTKNPLHPCRSNKWFQVQCRTLKLLWPHRLEDSFTRSPETGLFKYTDEFNQRNYDINCWKFGPDMYQEFLVVYGLAPSRGAIPGTLGLVGARGAAVEGKRVVRRCVELTDAGDEMNGGKGMLDEKVRESDVRTMVEADTVDYSNLHWRQEKRDGKTVAYFTLW